MERLLLARFAPASVVVNDRGDVVYIHGRTGAYLEPASCQPRLNILDMAREGLQLEIASALRHAVAVPAADFQLLTIPVQSSFSGDDCQYITHVACLGGDQTTCLRAPRQD